jgi:hypothetical protein
MFRHLIIKASCTLIIIKHAAIAIREKDYRWAFESLYRMPRIWLVKLK